MSLRVLMMPDFRAGNPYQSLLASALKPLDVEVSFPQGYKRVLPIFRATGSGKAQVLHLHWISPYLRGRNAVSHLFYAAKLWFDLCLVRMKGVKIVWTIHNVVSHEAHFPRIERAVQNGIGRLALRVIVHSVSALRRMNREQSGLHPAKFSIIPHGNYTNAYSAPVPANEAKEQLGLPLEKKTIFLFFGLVRPYKNVEGLIEAWKSAPELARCSTLVIAGHATDPQYRSYIAGLGSDVPGLVLRLAHIPDPEVHLYFSAADVVVLPFTRILTSGSLLLAITFAKPVIAPRLDTVMENLSGADDLVYETEDANGIRKSLCRAVSPGTDLTGLRMRMAELCAGLSWDRIAALTESAYRGVL